VVGQQSAKPRAVSALQKITAKSGGKLYLPKKQNKDAAIIADIENELASLFSIEYTLDQKPDNRLHKLEIKCNKSGVTVAAPDRDYARKP
jgi:hypothetical protein